MRVDINLTEIGHACFAGVSFKAKVIQVDDEVVVGESGLKIQNVIVADSTNAAKMAIWEGDIGSVEQGKSYYFEGFVINVYKNEKFFQWPRSGATVTEIEDIGKVHQNDVPGLETVLGVVVAGVLNLD